MRIRFHACIRNRTFILLFSLFLCIFSGILLGRVCSSRVAPLIANEIRYLPYRKFSVFAILVAYCPLIITAISIRNQSFNFVYFLSWFEGFLISFAIECFYSAFPASGWLVTCLLLSSRCLSFAAYCVLWFGLFFENRKLNYRNVFICGIFLTCLSLLDLIVIQPFISVIFNH